MKSTVKAQKWSEIKTLAVSSILTNNAAFNEFFSRKGGFIKKSFILCTGTPGAGKTTLMVNIMEWCPEIVSYFYSREASGSDVKEQIGELITHNNANFSDRHNCSNFDAFMDDIEKMDAKLVIVDSLQAIASEDYPTMNVDTAINNMRIRLTRFAEDHDAVVIAIGHVTKEGVFAGANMLMQMCHIHFELDASESKQGIRKMTFGQKNRKGDVTKVLYYEIHDGKISVFTPDEYQDKLNPISKVDFVKNIEQTLKAFEKVGKNNASFVVEWNAVKKQLLVKAQGNKMQFIADQIMLMPTYIAKYGF